MLNSFKLSSVGVLPQPRRPHSILSVLAMISLVLLMSIKPHEASRVLHEDKQIWMMRKKHLFLPSLWNPVKSPTPNPGINSNSPLGEKKFAATGSLINAKNNNNKKWFSLPSLWTGVTPPASNPGINSYSSLEDKNFAAAGSRRTMRKKHLLLPSLQWRPVTSPSTNPGHNLATVSEKNFAAENMPCPPQLYMHVPLILEPKATS